MCSTVTLLSCLSMYVHRFTIKTVTEWAFIVCCAVHLNGRHCSTQSCKDARTYIQSHTHTHAHTHTHTHTHARTHAHTHARTHARTHAHTHARTHARTHTHTHTHKQTHIHIHAPSSLPPPHIHRRTPTYTPPPPSLPHTHTHTHTRWYEVNNNKNLFENFVILLKVSDTVTLILGPGHRTCYLRLRLYRYNATRSLTLILSI